VFLIPLLDQLSSFVFLLVAHIEDTRADQPEDHRERDRHQHEEEDCHAEHEQDLAKRFLLSPIGRAVRDHSRSRLRGGDPTMEQLTGVDGDGLHDDGLSEVIPNCHHELGRRGRSRSGGGIEVIVENEIQGPEVNSFVLILETVLSISGRVGGLVHVEEGVSEVSPTEDMGVLEIVVSISGVSLLWRRLVCPEAILRDEGVRQTAAGELPEMSGLGTGLEVRFIRGCAEGLCQ
jgi:PAS domain-containing protein